ncbi:MoaD/ThiS family protein [Neptunicella sp.]|uniref:MoaD/ThiS family protein n=1 Tax=Neptunicella sp. TaxID=2125986 RepID=UPI003F68EDAE
MLEIRFFAMFRERLKCDGLRLEYEGQHDVGQLKILLASRGGDWEVLGGHNVLAAVNQTLCGEKQRIHDGDEIAFFPPVTGG